MSGPEWSSAEDDLRTELSQLSELDYEQQRGELIKRYGVRTRMLDRLYHEEHPAPRREPAGFDLHEIEPWPDAVRGVDVLDDLEDALRRFVVIDPEPLAAVALWVVHADALEAFGISPILLITAATKGCGKSTLLEVVGRMVPRPLMSAATTAAALYRSAEHLPTILCDEGDTYLGADPRLVTFFNAGHRRGVPFRICEGDDNHVKAYPSWCPKALAMIGKPRAATITDRSVMVELRRKLAGDQADDFSGLDPYPELEELGRRCARWAADHTKELRSARPDLPAGFMNRLADNWRPFFAIADSAGGHWPERSRDAARGIGQIADEGLEILLLEDLRELFEDRDALYTTDAVDELRALSGRPWDSCNRGRGITGRWLAVTLTGFGIQPDRILNGSTRKRGYARAQFVDAWLRYLPEGAPGHLGQGGTDASSPQPLDFKGDGHLDGMDGSEAPLARSFASPKASDGDIL